MFFYGGEDGILLLLSKGALHLSPENFRLWLNFQSHVFSSHYNKKITQAFCLCYFYGGEDGILLLLSKGALHLSPENFRLWLNFQSHVFSSHYNKKITQAFCLCYFYGGEDGIRTHVAFGQTVFKTASL